MLTRMSILFVSPSRKYLGKIQWQETNLISALRRSVIYLQSVTRIRFVDIIIMGHLDIGIVPIKFPTYINVVHSQIMSLKVRVGIKLELGNRSKVACVARQGTPSAPLGPLPQWRVAAVSAMAGSMRVQIKEVRRKWQLGAEQQAGLARCKGLQLTQVITAEPDLQPLQREGGRGWPLCRPQMTQF